MTDVELDARVTALEENGGGGGNPQNGNKVVFSYTDRKKYILFFRKLIIHSPVITGNLAESLVCLIIQCFNTCIFR